MRLLLPPCFYSTSVPHPHQEESYKLTLQITPYAVSTKLKRRLCMLCIVLSLKFKKETLGTDPWISSALIEWESPLAPTTPIGESCDTKTKFLFPHRSSLLGLCEAFKWKDGEEEKHFTTGAGRPEKELKMT
jgi:hypothetical protein